MGLYRYLVIEIMRSLTTIFMIFLIRASSETEIPNSIFCTFWFQNSP